MYVLSMLRYDISNFVSPFVFGQDGTIRTARLPVKCVNPPNPIGVGSGSSGARVGFCHVYNLNIFLFMTA